MIKRISYKTTVSCGVIHISISLEMLEDFSLISHSLSGGIDLITAGGFICLYKDPRSQEDWKRSFQIDAEGVGRHISES